MRPHPMTPEPLVLEEAQTDTPMPAAPEELTAAPLRRLGEGIGKVVYASEHWVVKRQRSHSAVLALIAIWRVVRRLERVLPGRIGDRLLSKPSRQIRALRVAAQAVVLVLPKAFWYASHSGQIARTYLHRSSRGEKLARERLAGTPLIAKTIQFPTTRVRVRGWPGWLTVSEATERVESTLDERLRDLAEARRFEEIETLLGEFLELRKTGWRRGTFSVDTHLKNFGVIGSRIVLLDAGGLTDDWNEIAGRLCFEEVVAEPHIQLGLGEVLGARRDIADRFNVQWKALVNREAVRSHLPESIFE